MVTPVHSAIPGKFLAIISLVHVCLPLPLGHNFELPSSNNHNIIYYTVFTRDSIYAIARISHGNSVRPSVCLSVCPSHGWISQKRLKLGSRSVHHAVAPSL